MWCVAQLDEEYIARMEDVLAVYEKPLSELGPVVCIDEKPVVMHREVRPPVAMRPGRVARRDGEYKRCGTANVFCGVQPKAGRHFTKVTNDRSSPEFADYLLDIAAAYPEADTIHLVMDNLSSHTCKAVIQRFGTKEGEWLWKRFTVHYTPKHGSWLNQAEIAIHQLVLPAMLGSPPDRRSRLSAAGNASLEPSRESRSSHDPVEFYPQESPADIQLHNHAVVVLACKSAASVVNFALRISGQA